MENNKLTDLINHLPFASPFLFVDELYHINENKVSGCFTFKKELDFFKGHFKNEPIVPGSILIECMAQIGGACLGLFLVDNNEELKHHFYVASSYNADFFLPVFPDEKIIITSEKVYNRFGKLKYKVEAKNEKNQIVSQGVFTGMLKSFANEK